MEQIRLVLGYVGLLALLAGCGGTTNRHRNDGGGGSDNPAGGSSTTSGTAGASGVAGAGGAAPIMTVDSFDTADLFVSIGLWMEFPDDKLPIGTPPSAHDGSALHLVGTTTADGLDVYFHTAAPVETIWSGVRFWTQSDAPDSFLTVAVAGPEPSYFKDRAQGLAWPERVVTLSPDWQEIVVNFADLGVDREHISPHSGPFGAFHFIIEPDTQYDLWIDDFGGQPLSR
jgi:hypothetical protein